MLIEYTDEVEYEPGYTKNMQRFIWWKGDGNEKDVRRVLGVTLPPRRIALFVLIVALIAQFVAVYVAYAAHTGSDVLFASVMLTLIAFIVCAIVNIHESNTEAIRTAKYAIMNAELWVYESYNQRSAWAILNNAVFDLWKERHDVGNVEYPNKEAIHDCLRMLGRHGDAVNGFLNSEDVVKGVAYMNHPDTSDKERDETYNALYFLASTVATGIFVIEDAANEKQREAAAPTLAKLAGKNEAAEVSKAATSR